MKHHINMCKKKNNIYCKEKTHDDEKKYLRQIKREILGRTKN